MLLSPKDLNLPPFQPFFLARSGWMQTIVGRYWPQLPDLKPDREHRVDLEDGDQLLIHENRPKEWKKTDRIVVMVHGLAGCYQSSYMMRMTRKLIAEGYGVVRINLRGCGPGFGMAKLPYHSGRSEDARLVLQLLEQLYPQAPVSLVGYSLGANIVLKMVGEDGPNRTGRIDSAVAVSPPANLALSAQRLTEKENRLFDRYFVRALKAHVVRLHDRFPEMEGVKFPKDMRLIDFDDHYTAPRSGYANAQDYYATASSAPLLKNIQLPCLLLTSTDDPVVDSTYLKELEPSPHLQALITDKGGHVAFLGWTGQSFRWMDEAILNWLRQ